MAQSASGEARVELSEDLLQAALEEVQERISGRELELSELQASLKTDRAEEALLQSLYALKTGRDLDVSGSSVASLRSRSAPHPIVDSTIEVLQEARRPMHISELMAAFDERGVRVPGSGTQANLISHISRDERIVRPSRGMYVLEQWDSTQRPAPIDKKRKRRVKSRARVSTPKGEPT
jgi:hypothetical protein